MKYYLSLIKFSHTIFALPFALLGFALATIEVGNGINWFTLLLVLFCMIFARSAAMAFNRYIDRDIDILNQRTATREIPAGVIQPKSALIFVLLNVTLFVATTWFINPLCFYLSPVALLVILGYSYTKRFTALCHFVLGLGLSFSPIGAYLAVTGSFSIIPVLYSIAVLCWVSGFDIIYAMQDKSFDQEQGLHSVPTFLGLEKSLLLSSFLHVLCAGLIIYASYSIDAEFIALGWLHWLGTLCFVGLLVYQHLLVKPNDLSKVDLAFFTTNGFASVLLCVMIITDLFL
ncbi:MAG: 4-hydroxybenzoate polyprenyltransferase [Polaribacter sp.]|jgi:4-hydroxybenzoate polyprenyltransferase